MLEESIDSSPNSFNSSIRRKREHRKTKRRRLDELHHRNPPVDLNEMSRDSEDGALAPTTKPLHGFKRFQAENMMASAECFDMPCKKQKPPELMEQSMQEFWTCERIMETQQNLGTESIEDDSNTTTFLSCGNVQDNKIKFESEWLIDGFDDDVIMDVDVQKNEILEQTLVPAEALDTTIMETEEQFEKAFVDWSTIEESPRRKTIVETILEDFCTSPSLSDAECDEELHSENAMPFFRFRRKKIRTYERCYRRTASKNIAASASKPATTCKANDDDCLSYDSDSASSELSVQEDMTQAMPTVVEPLQIVNTSNRIRNNLMNLSAFFTQNVIDNDDDEIEEDDQNAASEHIDEVHETSPIDLNFSDLTTSIRQIIKEILTLRSKYPILYSFTQKSEDFHGFPLQKEISNDWIECNGEDLETRNVQSRSEPILLRNCDSNVLPQISCSKTGDAMIFDEEDSWQHDSDFFANFQTQAVLKTSSHSETYKTRRKSDSTLQLTARKKCFVDHNDSEKTVVKEAYSSRKNRLTPKTRILSDRDDVENIPCHRRSSKLLQDPNTININDDDKDFESLIPVEDILQNFQSPKKSPHLSVPPNNATETSKCLESDFDCMILSEWPLNESKSNEKDEELGLNSFENVRNHEDQRDEWADFALSLIQDPFTTQEQKKEPNITTCFTGFQTASRKTINVSEEARKKIESVFANLPDLPGEKKEQCNKPIQLHEVSRENREIEAESANSFTGFQTASRKAIHISEEACKKIESVFANLPDLPGEKKETSNIPSQLPKMSRENQEKRAGSATCFTGFQTASRKAINVSEEACKKIESVFANLPDLPDEKKETSNIPSRIAKLSREKQKTEPESATCFTGFQTASRKAIKVSEEACKKIESVFANLPDLPDEKKETSNIPSQLPKISRENQEKRAGSATCFTGFQTASRKAINVSEEACKKIETVFANLPDLADEREEPLSGSILNRSALISKKSPARFDQNQLENLEDLANLPLSEWIPNRDSPIRKAKNTKENKYEPENSMKRRLTVYADVQNNERPSKILCKSESMDTPTTSNDKNPPKGRLRRIPSTTILGRKNLLSLTKRRRESLRSENNINHDPQSEFVETPVKMLSIASVSKNSTEPHTPQANEFFEQLPTAATSTPQLINAAAEIPIFKQHSSDNLDADFKRINWENTDDMQNNNSFLSATPTRLDKTLKPQPSPQERIENLSSCGDPPPLLQLIDCNNRSRSLGISRRRQCLSKKL